MSSTASVRTRPWTGYATAMAVVLIWAAFSLSARHAALGTGVRLTPWDLGGLRHIVSGAVASAMVLSGRGRGLPWRRSFVMGTVAGICFPLPAFVGFLYAPAAHGAVILSGTLPFLVGIMIWAFTREPWTRARLLSLMVLLAGMACLGFEAFVHGSRPGAWRGDLLFFASAMVWAAYTLIARSWTATPSQAVVAVGLWSAALYVPVWLVALPSHVGTAPIGEVIYQAIYQGLFGTVLSLFLFTRALELLGPARLTTITALVPGVAGVLAMPLLGEPASPLDLLGLALVCVAVGLGVRR